MGAFPQRVREALKESTFDGATLAIDHLCDGAKFHSPTPLLVSEVSLRPDSGGEPFAFLCGVCQDNLIVLHHLLEQFGGEVPWPVRREFGNLLRALAMKGWEAQHA